MGTWDTFCLLLQKFLEITQEIVTLCLDPSRRRPGQLPISRPYQNPHCMHTSKKKTTMSVHHRDHRHKFLPSPLLHAVCCPDCHVGCCLQQIDTYFEKDLTRSLEVYMESGPEGNKTIKEDFDAVQYLVNDKPLVLMSLFRKIHIWRVPLQQHFLTLHQLSQILIKWQ